MRSAAGRRPRPGLAGWHARNGLVSGCYRLILSPESATLNGSTEGSLRASSTFRPLRRGLLLGAALSLGVALAACGGGDDSTPVTVGGDGALEVIHQNLSFEPRDMAFDVGQTVEFTLVSKDIPHTFTVKDLGIDWEVSKEPQVQTFTFEEAGTFKLICAVPGHEGSGMVGTVEVR